MGKELRIIIMVTAILTSMAGIVPTFAQANNTLESQQKLFKQARKAVRNGSITRYRKLRVQLDDYPLRGYLDYEYLKRQLYKPRVKDYQQFFIQYQDSPIANRLRGKWLTVLAKQGRWKLFLEYYKDLNSTRLECSRALALQNIGKTQQAKVAAEKLWLTGKSQPRRCDTVFKNWRARGEATPELIWQRIRLAMHKRKPNLAKYLAKFLGPSERKWVERWRQMYRRPAKMLGHKYFRSDTPLVREIVLHGVERLARIDANEAAKRWQKIKTRYRFSNDDIGKIQRRIGLSAATQGVPEALEYIKQVDPKWMDDSIQTWRVRSALHVRDWNSVLQSVDSLSAEQQQKDNWQYWRARALRKLGFEEKSIAIYQHLAKSFSYPGLLAADKIGANYSLNGTRLVSSKQEVKSLQNIPGIARAMELYKLGMTIDARREWRLAISEMSTRKLQVAAIVASTLGWHDRAVLTIGKTNTLDDLKLRYPVVFKKQVLRHALHNKIAPAWVYGVLRQESAYMTDARSHAGALGLMQLMPRTARSEARKLRIRLRNSHEILNVDKNIRLGTAHLKRVLDLNKGRHVLATASYNAGFQRVKSWLPKSKSIPADIWIETIPFRETRKYVKRVMSTMAVFEKHLDQPVTPLLKRLDDIKPKS